MAVSTTNGFDGPYTANGVTTSFPFTFTAPTAGEVSVLLRDASGVESVASPSLYTVTLGSVSGGTVVFGMAPATGNALIVYLDPFFTQEIAFEDGSAWRASPVNEQADRSAARDQALKREADRALKVPLDESGLQIPVVADRAEKALFFDASGDIAPISVDDFAAPAAAQAELATGYATILSNYTLGIRYSAAADGVDPVVGVSDGRSYEVLTGGRIYGYKNVGGVATGPEYELSTTASFVAALGDLRITDSGASVENADWPGFAPGLTPNATFSVLTRNSGEGGVGKAGVYSFMVNGTGNMEPFTTIGGYDSVPLSAVVYSGEDAPYPVCATNIVSRYAGLPVGINWGLEIDMNNESPTAYTSGDPRGGQGLVLNTGSTYSPDTAIVVQRAAGEGTGPGWKNGLSVKGARDVAIYVQAMTATSAPGMSPAATGTVTALAVNVGGETYNRFTISESGRMDFGGGAAAQDVYLTRSGVGALATSGTFNATQYFIGANAVVGSRKTGWATATGTATRTTFDTATITTAQLAERVKALIDDLHATAGHGLIGA